MQAFRAGVFALASLVLSSAFAPTASADVRPIAPAQILTRPATPSFTSFGDDVAIDGRQIIVLATHAAGQQALFYRRNTNGQWAFRRVLVSRTGAPVHAEVAMRNGIAAIQFGDQISLFELSNGDYLSATTVAPIRHHGGLAISNSRVLIGGNNCDYDAVIYQKNTAGRWDVTGRIDDNQGECFSASEHYNLELNYEYALLHAPYSSEARAWRRNGTAQDWISSGTLTTLPDEPITNDAWALQGATAVAASGVVFRRSGTSTWTRQGVALSIDRDDGGPATYGAVYRDGVLVTSEATAWRPFPRVYIESSPGQFEHVATLATYDGMGSGPIDVSGRTVVVAVNDFYGPTRYEVRVSTLPAQLRAPPTIVNDFEDREISDFTFSGGQFVLATRGADDVLVQNSTSGLAVGLVTESDWTDDQRVEADVTPAWGAAGSWVGLVARYSDPDNYYYVTMQPLGYTIRKRVNGVDSLLFEGSFYNTRPPTFRAQMIVIRNTIYVDFGFQQGTTVTDNSLVRGRAGVATWLAQSDFNNVLVSPTDQYYPLFSRDYGYFGYDFESGLEELSGTWQNRQSCDEENCWQHGLSQTDTSGNAVAVIGTPIGSQAIGSQVRLDAFAPSQQGAWFGLLARYVDARNHYYVTVRSSGQVQIRKMVNGVITVLASTNFVVPTDRYVHLQFVTIADELHLYVDRQLLLTAHDRDIAAGRYGIATYRAAATWDGFWVHQHPWPR